MKKSIFLGLCISLVVSFSCTAFGATAEVLGDISMGNHKNAPYSQSNIIVPRPSSSKYLSMPLYNNTSIPSDIKGHWAESYIKYFLEKGYISLENNKFNPNEIVTYGDFAELVSRIGLKPIDFNGGKSVYRMFSDYMLWETSGNTGKSALICAEAGVWGTPTENTQIYESQAYTIGFKQLNMNTPAQRQYIVQFLGNFLENQTEHRNIIFIDMNKFSNEVTKEAANKLVSLGIVSGFTDSTFRPQNTITKAEMVTMLYRILQYYNFDIIKISDVLYGNYYDYYWNESLELLELVNEERIALGITPLKYDADLNALCEIKNIEKSIYGYDTFEDKIQYDGKTIAHAHVSDYWGRATEMAEDFGMSSYLVGENAVMNASSAEKSHTNLSSSPAHKANYLNEKYKVAGFSVGEKLSYEMFAYFK